MSTKKEQHRAKTYTTLVVLLFVLTAFMVSCWHSPPPPWPEPTFGFMIANEGSPSSGITLEKTTEKKEVIEETTEELIEETSEELTVDESLETINTDSDVSVSEETKEVIEELKTEEKAVFNPTVPDPEEEKEETNSSIDQKSIYKGTGGASTDDGGKVGTSLTVPGWSWDKAPKADGIQHSGEITFSFKVTRDGELRELQVINSSFTPSEINLLKEKIYKLSFHQTAQGLPPLITRGTLTWKVVAR